MRFREILESLGHSKFPKNARYGIPGARVWPELDNSSPYNMYRMLVAMAGSPNGDMEKSGPTGSNMITFSYTDADEEIAIKAGKELGYTSKELTTHKSEEMPQVNKTSPVPLNSGKTKRK